MKQVDLTRQIFGKLTAIKESPERLRNEVAWICECSCGNETTATRGQLLRGTKKSCGCLRKKTPPNALDLSGKKFGKLTVIERAGMTKNENALWLCKCDCGEPTEANATSLRRGEKVSCGCAKEEQIRQARKILTEEKTVDGVQVPLLTKKVRSDSKTGHKGVHRRNRRGKEYFEASITIKGKRKYLGTFKDINDAIAARKQAEIDYHQPYIKALEEKDNDK
ncbi:hypothetical protein [Bacillus sp. REN10]|uniref:hypothetical protein n=1 Tax=Bacillus sp. REN10 TaxID=2782541 RepID=UPI00193BF4EA|nr:hypothetical protein [Bacillus sp. REN10]